MRAGAGGADAPGADASSSTHLVLATHNQHKVAELYEILQPLLGDRSVRLLSMRDFPEVPEPVESEVTFIGNATLKARSVATATGLPALADDSGLAVQVLGGCPGVFSARWSGLAAGRSSAERDADNWRLLLDQLADVPDGHRNAAFVCAAVLALPDGSVRSATGKLEGVIARSPQGSGGFGYDPILRLPDGRHVAELDAAAKNRLSHRGQAFRALVPDLLALVGLPSP